MQTVATLHPQPMLRFLLALFALMALLTVRPALAQEESPFQAAPELRRDIDFWKRVFAEWSQDEIVAHDRDDLGIVYRVDHQPRSEHDAVRRRNSDEQDAIKARVRRILLDLAARDPDPRTLAGEYRAIYDAFGPEAGPDRWRRAADQVRIQRGLKERFHAGLQRAGRYHDHIVSVLEEEGVPTELAWLPMIETTFILEARSSVGAAGAWQFMPSTGRLYMTVGRSIDERFDPILAARGAARLLKYNYDGLGTWPLALTAYNHGFAGMKRAVREVGSNDFLTIRSQYNGPRFGFASRNFYPEFIAALEVVAEAERHFGPIVSEPVMRFDLVEIPSSMALEEIAAAIGVEPRTLWEFNLSLTDRVRTGQRPVPAGFVMRVPEGAGEEAPTRLASAIAARGQRVRTVDGAEYYTVQRGDTLSMIAVRHGTSVSALIALNDIEDRDRIQVGQRLRISG